LDMHTLLDPKYFEIDPICILSKIYNRISGFLYPTITLFVTVIILGSENKVQVSFMLLMEILMNYVLDKVTQMMDTSSKLCFFLHFFRIFFNFLTSFKNQQLAGI